MARVVLASFWHFVQTMVTSLSGGLGTTENSWRKTDLNMSGGCVGCCGISRCAWQCDVDENDKVRMAWMGLPMAVGGCGNVLEAD